MTDSIPFAVAVIANIRPKTINETLIDLSQSRLRKNKMGFCGAFIESIFRLKNTAAVSPSNTHDLAKTYFKNCLPAV